MSVNNRQFRKPAQLLASLDLHVSWLLLRFLSDNSDQRSLTLKQGKLSRLENVRILPFFFRGTCLFLNHISTSGVAGDCECTQDPPPFMMLSDL